MSTLHTIARGGALLAGLCFAFAWTQHASAQDTMPADEAALRTALSQELARSMAQLRLDGQLPPYYIAYELATTRTLGLQAAGGVLSDVDDAHHRVLFVDVRVGTPASDSSRVASNAFGVSRASELTRSGATRLPLGSDPVALRRKLWIATDTAYKRALEDYATRQAVHASRAQDDQPPDLIAVEPLQRNDDQGVLHIDLAQAEALLRDLSSTLDATPGIEVSAAWLNASESSVHFVASDGTATWTRRPRTRIGYAAATRADDGEPLLDHVEQHAWQPAGLPARDTLLAGAREMSQRLAALRNVEPLRDYTGPVLFSGHAAGQLVGLRLAPKLAPLPRYFAVEMQMQGMIDQITEPTRGFARRIGGRVLPAGAELVDDPTLRTWQDTALPSAAAFDGEGVPTQRKQLVTDGRLRELLATRAPAVREHTTPGNMSGAMPGSSTLLLRSDDAVDAAGMRREIELLLQGAQTPWILEVERFADPALEARINQSSFSFIFGAAPQLPRVARANRLYPDGRREPLRGLRLPDIGERDFRHIVAIGDTPTLQIGTPSEMNFMGLLGRRSNVEPVRSYIVPALLFEELSAAEDTKEARRVPLLGKPSDAVPQSEGATPADTPASARDAND